MHSFEEKRDDQDLWSVFSCFLEQDIWECAQDILLSEYSGQFVHMIDDSFEYLHQKIEAKALLISIIQETNNVLLYKLSWTSILNNLDAFENEENKKIESIAGSRFKSDQHVYIREKSIEGLVFLVIAEKASPYKALSLLEEISIDWPTYLATKAIKLLGHLYDKKPEDDIIQMIERVTTTCDPRILSEAAHHIGLIHLRKSLECIGPDHLISELQIAHKWFARAEKTIENRDDSEFYKLVVSLFISLLGSSRYDEKTMEHLDEIIEKRWIFSNNDYHDVVLEVKIYELFQNLKQVFQKIENIDSWLDISAEIIDLANIYSLQKQIGYKSLYASLNDAIREKVFLPKVQTSIYHRISAAKQKVQLIKSKHHSSFNDAQLEFVDAVLDYCMTNPDPEQTKKKELRDNALTKLSLVSNVPTSKLSAELDLALKEGRFEQHLIDKLGDLGLLIFDKNEFAYETGYPIGDEILARLKDEVHRVLPQYPERKLKAYLTVLGGLISYNIFVNDVQRNDRGKNRGFLFSKKTGGTGQDASEGDLQQDVFDYLLGSRFAGFVEWEKSNVASGRVDIRVNYGDIRLPIEIKKELRDVSEDHIKSMYIAQAQTYTASYDQLGFFMVLDLTDKELEEPSVNIQDHFYLAHVKPQDNIKVNYPDYVTVILVTGNRLTPHQRSTYSRKK